MQLNLKPDFNEAKEVIYELHLKGLTNIGIAKKVNSMGYRTMKGYKFGKGYISHIVSKMKNRPKEPEPKTIDNNKLDLKKYLIDKVLNDNNLQNEVKLEVIKGLLNGSMGHLP